jgi:hypothetical protein
MTFQRIYQPEAAFSDELVEALYQLLMNGSDGSETPDLVTAAAPASTCVQDANE